MTGSPEIIQTETLIIGAGLIGSSVAMHLAQLGMSGVRVIDVDLEGTLSSSELNAGGVRATWTQPLNIRASQLSIDYFASVADQVGYRACGYLWLHRPDRWASALAGRERQVEMGWPVDVWDVAELRRKHPFIDKTDDLAGAIYAPRDGLLNPNLLRNHFRDRARSQGVAFDDRTRLLGAEYAAGAGPARVTCERLSVLGEDRKIALMSGQPVDAGLSTVVYEANRVINCAGAWAGEVAQRLAYRSPAFAVRRQVCIFDCRDVDLTPYGMIIDPTGVYFHPEATNGLAGIASHEEPHGANFKYDGDSFFMESIWPALYERSTGFERLKHLTGWAGLYEVSPDESAIVGEVEADAFAAGGLPGISGDGRGRLFEAHSFSGHGVMHSYSAGLALAEKIVHGRYETLDLTPLAGSRFSRGLPLQETWVI